MEPKLKEAIEVTTAHVAEKWNEICEGLAGKDREMTKKYGAKRVFHDLEFRFDGYINGMIWGVKTFLKLNDLETHALATALEAHFEAESKNTKKKIEKLEAEFLTESIKELVELARNTEIDEDKLNAIQESLKELRRLTNE